MSDFHMKRAYNKRARPRIAKKVSNFEDHVENFYSDKMVYFYNMRFHATYSTIITLQRNRALFRYQSYFGEKMSFCNR
jgi:hypothetical protein